MTRWSKTHAEDAVHEKLRESLLVFAARMGVDLRCDDAEAVIKHMRQRWEFEALRDRLLERKRAALLTAQERIVRRESDTRINYWRRRMECGRSLEK